MFLFFNLQPFHLVSSHTEDSVAISILYHDDLSISISNILCY